MPGASRCFRHSHHLLTAKDSELDYVMGISQGSDDYLTKPFRPTILLMKVRAAAPGGDGQGENSGGSR